MKYYKTQNYSNSETGVENYKCNSRQEQKQYNNINKIKTNKVQSRDNKQHIADILNTHFTEVGPKLAEKLPASFNHFSDYLNPAASSFLLKLCKPNKVLKILKELHANKATELDHIPCKLSKEAADIIAEPLCLLFNTSILKGFISDHQKLAKVFLLHKGNDKSNPNNYRPISVITSVAKLWKKIIVYDQFHCYLPDNKLLTKYQSGFRSLHLTVTALLYVTKQWYFNIDNDVVTAVVFIDLAKAFDTIDYKILL